MGYDPLLVKHEKVRRFRGEEEAFKILYALLLFNLDPLNSLRICPL
jgi:hypothetical protein